MNIFLLIFIFAVVHVNYAVGELEKETTSIGLKKKIAFDRKLLALDASVAGCMEIPKGTIKNGSEIVLGDCKNYTYGFSTDRFNSSDFKVVRFRSRMNPTYCVQAQHGGVIREGGLLRLYPCNTRSRRQIFYYDVTKVKPIDKKNLCAVYEGHTPNVNKDKIILLSCAKVDAQAKSGIEKQWSED